MPYSLIQGWGTIGRRGGEEGGKKKGKKGGKGEEKKEKEEEEKEFRNSILQLNSIPYSFGLHLKTYKGKIGELWGTWGKIMESEIYLMQCNKITITTARNRRKFYR